MHDSPPAATGGWWAKLTLEYDGTAFAGSQIQPRQRTVQGVIAEALARLTGEWHRVTLAGRTDAGVHASGQVAGLIVPERLPPAVLQRGLNALLPEDVAVVAVARVRPGFHARYDALSRRYAYRVWNSPVRSALRRRTSWQVRPPLLTPAMQAAGAALIGEHDFASFAGAGRGVPDEAERARSTRRRVTDVGVAVLETAAQGRLIGIEIEATAFLPHMVRNIVGALVEVGLGRWPVERFQAVLMAADRRQSAPTAPPQGLCLTAVTYAPEWEQLSETRYETGAA